MTSKQEARQVETPPAGPSINAPDILAEVEAVFARYEAALISNDVATLDDLFWKDERTVRFGIGENLYGYEAIAAFRAARPSSGLDRRLIETVITTFGRDFATASTLFFRDIAAPGRCGRQMQTWLRTSQGWRVVAAHVSVIEDPAKTP